ncbi:MAG: hypothetical protein IBX57_01115 [Gammaproteobacteria bacterium]|nr:hypothetical protein [Gammaproteobacteria bacterium]
MSEVRNKNLMALSHAVELGAKVIRKVAGEEIATTLKGDIVTDQQIKSALSAKIQNKILSAKGGQK